MTVREADPVPVSGLTVSQVAPGTTDAVHCGRIAGESERDIGGRAAEGVGDAEGDGLGRYGHGDGRGGGRGHGHAERGGDGVAEFDADSADGVGLGSEGGGAAQADIALQRSIGSEVGGAEDLLDLRTDIGGALAEGGDLHEETAGLLQDQAVRELAAWVGLRVLEHGGGRALQRHAGGCSGIDGIDEGDGDILRPLGAVQIFTFEMEDAIEGNGEVVAGEPDGECAFGGDDDGAGCRRRRDCSRR